MGNFLSLRLSAKKHEVFTVLFLDAQNRLIRAEDMFRGSLTHCEVYPRKNQRRARQRRMCKCMMR
ncbi:MAG: JAB domain-containing protein [Betaproteobacteria bacterium]